MWAPWLNLVQVAASSHIVSTGTSVFIGHSCFGYNSAGSSKFWRAHSQQEQINAFFSQRTNSSRHTCLGNNDSMGISKHKQKLQGTLYIVVHVETENMLFSYWRTTSTNWKQKKHCFCSPDIKFPSLLSTKRVHLCYCSSSIHLVIMVPMLRVTSSALLLLSCRHNSPAHSCL